MARDEDREDEGRRAAVVHGRETTFVRTIEPEGLSVVYDGGSTEDAWALLGPYASIRRDVRVPVEDMDGVVVEQSADTRVIP